MLIEFTGLPTSPTANRINRQYAQNIVDSLLANPGQWAKIDLPTLMNYNPDTISEKQHKGRINNFVHRIKAGKAPVFRDHPIDATQRGSQVYLRAVGGPR